MKNSMITLAAFSLLLIVSACSSAEGEKAKEVFKKSAAASEELDSFSMEMEMTQKMNVESEDSEEGIPDGIPLQTTMNSDMQMDPVAFYQTVEFMGQSMEQYYTEDGMYMTVPGEENWYKAPEELVDQLNQISSEEQSPGNQLENLEEYVDEFNLEEKENSYLLSFSSEGENVQALIEESVEEMFPEGTMPEDALEGLTVEQVNYTFEVDKESYYPKQLDAEMNFTMNMEGEETSIHQTMSGSYSNFNEVGEIEIPSEVIEQAEDLPDSGNTPQ
ncbi:hypothetical protein GCM10010954_35170 [Halobacillus andaensis]|uniref:Lipoprotein n=1 Tax=Halobacillus andaensis TaxID=1176239 RepID=A0A917BA79_HALAA|nr:DUF6612 family protein [Halobacillus andaensis]MBP2005624.1 hypothetical protein [Halobacillus andaensis]GGF32958.1 hypothetical protein GCM10010954_35170 [Halobacillus andaensis]